MRGPRHFWTGAELETLRATYPDGGLPAALAALPHITARQIAAKVNVARLTLSEAGRAATRAAAAARVGAGPPAAWRADELAALRATYPEGGLAAARAALPSRSDRAILEKARLLRLPEPPKAAAFAAGCPAFAAILAAARAGRPAPTRGDLAAALGFRAHPNTGAKALARLVAAGAVRVEHAAGDKRRLVVLFGPHAGLATAWHKHGRPPREAAAPPPPPPAADRPEARRAAARGAAVLAALGTLAGSGARAHPAAINAALASPIALEALAATLAALEAEGAIAVEYDWRNRCRYRLADGRRTAWGIGAERIAAAHRAVRGRRAPPPPSAEDVARLVAEYRARGGEIRQAPPAYAAETQAARPAP